MFLGIFIIFSSVAPHRRSARSQVQSQVATHQKLGGQLWTGEMPDSNPGLQDNSLVHYHWATTPSQSEMKLSISPKTWCETGRFRRNPEVKLCIFGSIQCIQWSSWFSCFWWTRGEAKRFRWKSVVKRCDFGDNAVFAKIRLCRRSWNLILTIIEILDLGLVYFWMMPKKRKRTIKSRACVPLRDWVSNFNFFQWKDPT